MNYESLRWYARPGKGSVCQVNRSDCEIILAEDAARVDRGRLFIEVTPDGYEQLRREIETRQVPSSEIHWGYDVIRMAGQAFDLRRDDAGGHTLASPEGDVLADVFLPSDSRPARYPATLPFIPGAPVTMSGTGTGLTMTWYVADNAEGVVREVQRQCMEDGYVLEDEDPMPGLAGNIRQYTNGTLSRLIMAGGPMITLMQPWTARDNDGQARMNNG